MVESAFIGPIPNGAGPCNHCQTRPAIWKAGFCNHGHVLCGRCYWGWEPCVACVPVLAEIEQPNPQPRMA